MILNNAKDINFGATPVNKIFLGNNKVWERNSLKFMPVMDGITDYFDCRQGMTDTVWKNLAGGEDASWTGMEIQSDGSAGITGKSWSCGQFRSPYVSERTLYTIFRTNPVGLVNINAPVIASCGGPQYYPQSGQMFSVAVEGYHEPDTIVVDQMNMGVATDATSGIVSDTYHVVAVTRKDGINTLYVDGEVHGTLINSVAYGDYWGIGVIVYYDNTISDNSGWEGLRQIKFISIANKAHSEETIKENSNWLIKEFISEVN